jgi:hypothetical protein
MPAPADLWPQLFALPEAQFGPAAAWARAHAAAHPGDPRALYDACPRADWLIAAASLSGLDEHAVINVLAQLLRVVTNELDRAGRPQAPELLRAIDVCEAWADGAASEPEVLALHDELLGGVGLAIDLATVTTTAARLATLAAEPADPEPPAGSRPYQRQAVALHAAKLLRDFAENLGPRGHEAVLEMLRAFLPWEAIEAALPSIGTEAYARELAACAAMLGPK